MSTPNVPAPTPMKRSQMVLVVLSSAITVAVLVGTLVLISGQSDMPKWVFARTTGIVAFILLWLATVLGILVSHPEGHRWSLIRLETRLRMHVGLSIFAILFTAFHLVVLAIDGYAEVGWFGALLPFSSTYRPLAVSLGVIAFWMMVLVSVSAALSNTKLFASSWRWMHRLSLLIFLLAWIHGVLAGSDTVALLALYLSTTVFIAILAAWRYLSPSIRNRRKSFARGSTPSVERRTS